MNMERLAIIKMEDGRRKMEDGRWKKEDGRRKMEDVTQISLRYRLVLNN